jgi:hypothetical protein
MLNQTLPLLKLMKSQINDIFFYRSREEKRPRWQAVQTVRVKSLDLESPPFCKILYCVTPVLSVAPDQFSVTPLSVSSVAHKFNTASAGLSATEFVHPIETFKDIRKVLFMYTDSRIRYGNDGRFTLFRDLNRDFPALWCKFQGITELICHEFLDKKFAVLDGT